MPQSATDILLAKGNLTSEQIAYLDKYTVTLGASTPVAESTPVVATSSAVSGENIVKGKTTFGELIAWGVLQETIESVIGTPMPDPAMILKDYAFANGLDFETLKPALQAEVDKTKP